MKKLLILIYALLITHPAYAINALSQYPKELQELGVYIDSTLDKVKNIPDMDKLDSYKGVFEEAYDYPVYESKENKGTATTFYMTYKNHQYLLSL